MKNSLVFKLSFLVSCAIIIAALSILVIVHNTTSTKYVEFLSSQDLTLDHETISSQLSDQLETLYRDGGMSKIIETVHTTQPGSNWDKNHFLIFSSDLSVIVSTNAKFEQSSITRLDSGNVSLRVDKKNEDGHLFFSLNEIPSRVLRSSEGEYIGEIVLLPNSSKSKGDEFASSVWKQSAIWLGLVLLTATVLSIMMLKHALRPVMKLTQAADDLKKGELLQTPQVKMIPNEFRTLFTAFESAVDSLDKTEKMRRQLVSDIAHELRTPVTNLTGQMEALDAGLLKADDEFIETMQYEIRLLQRLATDFQQILLFDSGRLRVNLQVLPLRDMLQNILTPMVSEAKACLECNISKDLLVTVDDDRMRQVLSNLFENSLREVPVGLSIKCHANIEGNQACLYFEDNGPGIAEDDQPYIFKRFFRAEKSRNRTTGGSGLGLTIVKGLLKAMDGNIEYINQTDSGAVFLIRLPLAKHFSLS